MAARRNNRRRPRQSGGRGNEQRRKREPEWEEPCPLCGEPILEISSAVTDRLTGQPAHFDCVMKKISDEEDIQENEKLCYLGNGSFGIVEKRSSGPTKFSIRKKIQYENKDSAVLWRRGFIKTDPGSGDRNGRKK